MDIRTREAVRYLGYGGYAVDERTLVLLEESFKELEQVADSRVVYRIFEIFHTDEAKITIGDLKIESRDLAKNLKNCKWAIIFGATLGTRVDMLMQKYSLTDMTKAVMLQACAAAELEEYCNKMQKQIALETSPGLYLKPRFSPGYGDFSILYQKNFLDILEAPKKIGLTMTDGYMLTPTKSVTAVIGISEEKTCC